MCSSYVDAILKRHFSLIFLPYFALCYFGINCIQLYYSKTLPKVTGRLMQQAD